MKILDKEIDFSFSKINNLEKIKKAYLEMQEAELKGDDFIEMMKNYCALVRNFVNEIFGEGFDKELFGEDDDYDIMTNAVIEISEEFIKNRMSLEEKYEKINKKYSKNRLKR